MSRIIISFTSIQQVYKPSVCNTREVSHSEALCIVAVQRHAQAVGKQLSVPEFPHTQAQLQSRPFSPEPMKNLTGYSSGKCALSQRNYSTITTAYPPETWVIISISAASYFPTAQIQKAFCDLLKELKDRKTNNVVTNYKRYFKFEVFLLYDKYIKYLHNIFCNILKLKYLHKIAIKIMSLLFMRNGKQPYPR